LLVAVPRFGILDLKSLEKSLEAIGVVAGLNRMIPLQPLADASADRHRGCTFYAGRFSCIRLFAHDRPAHFVSTRP
jgi:hypothetical protein